GRGPAWVQAVAVVFAPGRLATRGAATGLEASRPGSVYPPGSTELGEALSIGLGEATILAHSPGAARRRARPADPLPERFGRCAVTARLGSGAFGSVYLARDDELGRLVAIKVPHPGRLRSPQQIESFLTEARMAAGLRHPAIVRVYDVGRYGEG